ncbi:MAG: 30S ribosomal protein S1 [Planctomycetota bacterium]
MNITAAFQKYGVSTATVDRKINDYLQGLSSDETVKLYEKSPKELTPHTIIKGKVVNISGNNVIIDIGYKSEGFINVDEFGGIKNVKIGDEVDIYIDEVENESGMVVISKSEADHLKGWELLVKSAKENSIIRGKVAKKIPGGYLVDVGVLAFLPSSQVDIRKESDANLLNHEIECKIIKIDTQRMNVIVSRKILIEEQRAVMKRKILSEIKEGDALQGVVKNIVDFGAFVDLGGIDALLHIGDMSWRRVSHPSEVVALDQSINVKILKIDPQSERVFVGLKQLTENPWEKVTTKYEPTQKVKGKVVNIVSYGVFVGLEPGIEGLLHISEMSWTKKISHPSELVAIGDIIEVVILKINPAKQEISLGMKQLEANPWIDIEKKYSIGTKIQGRVKNVTAYGAFIEIEEGVDGLIHQSDMIWTRKTVKPASIVKKGDKIEAVILSIDPVQKRVSLGLKQLTANPWETTLVEKYPIGTIIEGTISKIGSKGVSLELDEQIEGFLPHKLARQDTGSGGDETSESIASDETSQLKTNQHIKVEVVELDPKECVVVVKISEIPS